MAVLANDSDVDGDTLSVGTCNPPGQGQVTRSSAATFTYTPRQISPGPQIVTYTVQDPGGLTATGTVTVASATPAGAPGGLTTGLVAAYNLTPAVAQTLADLSGNGHTGTIAGAAWTAGQIRQGADLDGVNDLGHHRRYTPARLHNRRHVMAWVYSTATSGIRDVLVKEGTGIDIYNLYARNRGGQVPE